MALRKKMESLNLEQMIESVFKSVLCSLAMGACLWWMRDSIDLPENFPQQDFC
jgi:hypothetical protein